MEANGRIEKRIIHHLYLDGRASKERLLTIVRRNGLPRTTKQELSQRVEFLKNTGVLELHHRTKRKEVYILAPSKRAELDANGSG